MLVNQLSGCRKRIKRAPGHIIIRLSALVVAVLFSLPIILTGCTTGSTDEPDDLADYGTYGSSFAHRLANRYPGRSPGSASERAAAKMITAEFERLGYEPEVTTYSFFAADDTTQSESEDENDSEEDIESGPVRKTSQNIIVSISGTGFVDEKEAVIRKQIIIGAHYDTAVGLERISPPETEPATDDETTAGETEESADDEENKDNDYLFENLEQDWTVYDGIHDNASGIGVLMALARQLKDHPIEYDVVLIAFGAGNADMAGSRHYAASMSQAAVANTDVMYNIDSIYAGDKVYAHAGWNALEDQLHKDYHLRRKLYELTDIFYENELYTNNQFMLYTNQATFFTKLPVSLLDPVVEPEESDPPPESEPENNETDVTNDDTTDAEDNSQEETTPLFIYREWTVRESDYRPFDKLNIPIVHFDSGDYNIQEIKDFAESNHPAFSPTSGTISKTAYDSTTVLNSVFDQRVTAQLTTRPDDETDKPPVDQLTRRVNNITFLIFEAAKKGRVTTLNQELDIEIDDPQAASEN